jgi:hypothetical protein
MNTRGVDEGVVIEHDGIQVRDLTLQEFYFNAIHVRAESDADAFVISNVKTLNIGERHIKGSRDSNDASKVSDDGLIEKVYMVQTHEDTNPDYIGGIDMMNVRMLIIRDCVAEGIVGAQNGGNAAIFLWNGIMDVLIERNKIVGCAKGIALGNPSMSKGNNPAGDHHAIGAMIRNNFVKRGAWTTGNNIMLELASVKNVSVYNNTLYSENAQYFRSISFFEASPGLNSGNILGYNLIRGVIFDPANGKGWKSIGNLIDDKGETIVSNWFANAGEGDLHLTQNARVAVNKAALIPEVKEDFDQTIRPGGSSPDLGANEFIPK